MISTETMSRQGVKDHHIPANRLQISNYVSVNLLNLDKCPTCIRIACHEHPEAGTIWLKIPILCGVSLRCSLWVALYQHKSKIVFKDIEWLLIAQKIQSRWIFSQDCFLGGREKKQKWTEWVSVLASWFSLLTHTNTHMEAEAKKKY